MGFLSSLFGTNNDYQYDTGGINNAQNQHDAMQRQQGVYRNQQGLATQLQQNAVGQGPNPAQEMLNRQTQLNNAQGAGFIASQKGINPALVARLSAQNAARSNQDAASQGAIMGAQQQLAAQNQLQQLYGTMGQQNISQQGMGQQGMQNMNAMNNANAQANANNNASMFGSVLGAVAPIGGLFGGGGGGLMDMSGASVPSSGSLQMPQMGSQFGRRYAEGGEIQQGSDLHSFLDGMINAKSGGQIPGKPQVQGDSYKNDTVPAMLSPGEVVIPNSIMQSKDPVGSAAKFVQAVMAKKKRMVK